MKNPTLMVLLAPSPQWQETFWLAAKISNDHAE